MNASSPPSPQGLPSLGLSAGSVDAAVRPPLSRNAVIAVAVVALHIGLIWALQSGLLMRAAELLVPAELLSQFVDPPLPKPEPVPPAPKPAALPTPIKKAIPKAPALPAPQPLAIPDSTPSPNAPTGVTTPQPAPAPISAPVAAAPVAAAGPPVVQLPSSDASYLQNPSPPYPAISRRMGEQGKTIIKVLIGVDGQPQRAEIARSSGFDRLDQAALATVMRWRFVPGKRGGVPDSMWFNVPINWVLE